MATTVARPIRTDAERPLKKQARSDIWTSLLKQTRIAQARNRTNALAHRRIVVCGGTAEDQRNFLQGITRPPVVQAVRRTRNESNEEKGTLALSNRYAYGYGRFSLYSAQQTGVIALSTESEEVARIECHCIPEADITYEPVLRHIFSKSLETQPDGDDDDEEGQPGEEQTYQPVVQILLSWKEPWRFLARARAWLQLLAKALLPPTTSMKDEDPTEVLKEHNIQITVVVQHVEAQQELEREGWTEETFDYACQVLRTIILPLSPRSSLLYTPSLQSQQPGTQLTEIQKVVYTSLQLDIASLSPRPTSSGGGSGTVNKDDLLPRHNIVDRMNIVIPGGGWDTANKIRHFSENSFNPDDVLAAWSYDLNESIFAQANVPAAESGSVVEPQRQAEEVYEASSPIEGDSLPPSPSKAAPSAIRTFESRIVDPNAHKAEKAPTITITTIPEQDFLQTMKVELDNYAVKDREKATPSPAVQRVVGMPSGESTGALDGLGDVSFNVGGVSYNTISAEAAIERLKRPHAPGVHDLSSSTSSRTGTPRPPRRMESDSTPGPSTPSSSAKAAFPADDLEKYFASLALKAGGGASRHGTPSREQP